MNRKDYEKMGGPFSPIYMADGTLEDSGLSIRDWFAGQALAGLLSNPHEDAPRQSAWFDREDTVRDAYQYADAMIKERQK